MKTIFLCQVKFKGQFLTLFSPFLVLFRMLKKRTFQVISSVFRGAIATWNNRKIANINVKTISFCQIKKKSNVKCQFFTLFLPFLVLIRTLKKSNVIHNQSPVSGKIIDVYREQSVLIFLLKKLYHKQGITVLKDFYQPFS